MHTLFKYLSHNGNLSFCVKSPIPCLSRLPGLKTVKIWLYRVDFVSFWILISKLFYRILLKNSYPALCFLCLSAVSATKSTKRDLCRLHIFQAKISTYVQVAQTFSNLPFFEKKGFTKPVLDYIIVSNFQNRSFLWKKKQ